MRRKDGIADTRRFASSDPAGSLQNSERALLEPTFWIGMGFFAILGARSAESAPNMGPFFSVCAAFLGRKNMHEKKNYAKTSQSPNGSKTMQKHLNHPMDRPHMHVV